MIPIVQQIKAFNPLLWRLPIYDKQHPDGYLPPEEAEEREENLRRLDEAKQANRWQKTRECEQAVIAYFRSVRGKGTRTCADVHRALEDYSYNMVHAAITRLATKGTVKRGTKGSSV